MNTLLVDRSPCADLLSAGGVPVWPVRSDGDFEALCRVARTFGGRLRDVRGRPAPLQRGPERVVGVGADTMAAATLYAHLTRRQATVVPEPSHLDEVPDLAVIVAPFPRITERLLATAAARSPQPGIVCAPTVEDLTRQVLCKAAAASLCGPVPQRRLDVYPLLPFGTERRRNAVLVGSRTPPGTMRRALTRGSGVVTINTHSDGVDMYLGPRLTLCPIDGKLPDADRAHQPACVGRAACHRHQMPLLAGWRAGRLVSPDRIAARVLVLNVCRGLLLPDSPVDPRWGLILRLLERNPVGAIVVTWEVVIAQYTAECPVSDRLAAGVPVGQALDGDREAFSLRAIKPRVCLLGDPRTRAAPDGLVTGWAHALRDRGPARARPAGGERHARLLRECLRVGPRLQPSSTRLARRALRALDRYEGDRLAGRRVEGSPTAAGPRLRRAVLHYLLRRRELLEDWRTFGRFVQVARPEPCAQCGHDVKRYVGAFPGRDYRRRWLDTCSNCGIVREVPSRTRMTISVDRGRTIRLHGPLPRRHWSAAVMISSWREERLWPWPAAADGAPAREAELPCGLPDRDVSVCLFLVWKTTVVMLRCRTIGAGGVEAYLFTPSPLEAELAAAEAPTADAARAR